MNHILWSIGHEMLLNDIVEGTNCSVYDSKGNRYTDLESGVWCTSLGHCHPRIHERITSQSAKLIHTGFNFGSPVIEEAASGILSVVEFPGGKCEFLCSGSEAVEYGLRAAKTLLPGKKTLTFSDSYFGAYGDATKKNNDDWHIYNWLACSCSHNGQGCTGECDEFSKIPFSEIGIFLFEPGSSSGLVRFPSPILVEKIAAAIEKNQGLIVVNEITTGIGRTGKWFGFQHYNLTPDVVAIGKGIGNGYPVSVAAFSEKVVKLFETRPFHYSQSHQNDPLGASVALEVINTILDDDLVKRAETLGKKIKQDLENAKTTHPIIKEVRGRGLMLVIELTREAKTIQMQLLKRGFLVARRPGLEVLRIDPALTIPEDDINAFMNEFINIIKNL